MIRTSTMFLRLSILGIGGIVLFLGVLLAPSLWQVYDEYPRFAVAVYVVLSAVYLSTIPYFAGLISAWKLLGTIDDGKAFTDLAVRRLRFISRCAAAISVIYFVSLPFFYLWADGDDAPGLVVIGMMFTAIPLVVAVAVSVLQRLLHEAIAIKNENELTV